MEHTAPPYRLIGEDVLRDVLSLVVKHQLSHRYDSDDLSIAIEFLKAVRDEGPERIAYLYESWKDEIPR